MMVESNLSCQNCSMRPWTNFTQIVLSKNKLSVGHHNLECRGGVLDARYRNLQRKNYDGVHMYGPSGMKAYTASVVNILCTAQLVKQNPPKYLEDFFCFRPQSLRIALFLCKIYIIILVKGVTIYRLGSWKWFCPSILQDRSPLSPLDSLPPGSLCTPHHAW